MRKKLDRSDRVWLAVDASGDEFIYSQEPRRYRFRPYWYLPGVRYHPIEDPGTCMRLPRGTIRRVTGMIVKWDNDPVSMLVDSPYYREIAATIGWPTYNES